MSGSGIACLTSARVLADHFEEVVVVRHDLNTVPIDIAVHLASELLYPWLTPRVRQSIPIDEERRKWKSIFVDTDAFCCR